MGKDFPSSLVNPYFVEYPIGRTSRGQPYAGAPHRSHFTYFTQAALKFTNDTISSSLVWDEVFSRVNEYEAWDA
jgi:hypothetical protein